MSIILDHGADTSTPKCRNIIPPLHYAIKLKQNECVSILLESGADKNLKTASVGATPIITAIASGNNVALELLLSKKADPNIPNSKGDRPIYYSIHQHDSSSLSMLISSGAKIDYKAIKYSIEMEDIECLHQLFEAIVNDKSIIELDEPDNSNNEADETDSYIENDKESTLNMKIKQFQRDALNLAKKLDRPSIELLLSLSPSKFESVEGKEFIEKLHQLIFTNLKILNEKLNDSDFISLFFTNQNKYLSRPRQNQNLTQFQGLTLNQKTPKRKSSSVSFSSGSHRSESDDFYYSRSGHFNELSNEENESKDDENESQGSLKFNSLFIFTNKIFSSIHNLNLYFRVLNTKSKALKSEIKEIDNKSKSGMNEDDNEVFEVPNEIVTLWANQLKKSNEILKQLDDDVISPNNCDSVSKWMAVIQKRKEFFENLFDKQIDESLSSSLFDDKKGQINSTLQTIRKCLKSREDHEFISKITSSFNAFVAKCKANMPHNSIKFDELVDLIQKDIVALPQNPTTRANRQIRGRISSNITQIITDKDKL